MFKRRNKCTELQRTARSESSSVYITAYKKEHVNLRCVRVGLVWEKKHTVRCQKSITRRRPAMFDEHCLISFSPVWVGLVPMRPSCRLQNASSSSSSSLMHMEKVCGSSLGRVFVFLKAGNNLLSSRDEQQSNEDLLQVRCFNYIWVSLLQKNLWP